MSLSAGDSWRIATKESSAVRGRSAAMAARVKRSWAMVLRGSPAMTCSVIAKASSGWLSTMNLALASVGPLPALLTMRLKSPVLAPAFFWPAFRSASRQARKPGSLLRIVRSSSMA